MKRRILAVAAVVLCLSVLAGGTLAYFTDSELVHNIITSGAVDVEVVETMLTPQGEVPYEDPRNAVLPGDSVSKIVRVRNNDAACYIRVKVEIRAEAGGRQLDAQAVGITMNTEHWTQKDGYWYYGSSVPTGGITEKLFEQVDFRALDMGNEYQNATITVSVLAQAVQTENNGATVWEADGWPAA